MTGPSISVVVPAYNAEPFIAETLEAILAQTRPPDEVIVVDDGSSDGTLDVLRRFRRDIHIVMKSNGGAASAHNTGFGLARGEYVARCDSDDIWEPTKLECQAEAVRAHPEIDLAFAGAQVFGELERPFSQFAGGTAPQAGIITDRQGFARSLYRANMICASSVLLRLSAQRRIGSFSVGYPNEDYDYWLRAARAGAVFYYDPAVLVRYRRHESSVTRNVVSLYEWSHVVHEQHAELVGSARRVRGALARDHFFTARTLLDDGDVAGARRELRSAIGHWPSPQFMAWAVVALAPTRWRRGLAASLGTIKHALSPIAG